MPLIFRQAIASQEKGGVGKKRAPDFCIVVSKHGVRRRVREK